MYKYFYKLNKIFALLILLILTPILIIFVVFIFFFIDKKIFFIQKRIGYNQKIFNCYKFSTMTENDNNNKPKTSDEETHRINSLGHLIRKLHIDELLQLVNIIKGDINFIGPRPHEVWHDTHYKERLKNHSFLSNNYSMRNLIKPGLTGLAQCLGFNGAVNDDQLIKRISYDILYTRKHSFSLDVYIIFKTLKIIITKNEEK